MPGRKTHRRRHHSKRKTSRRHTRKQGGAGCESLRARFEALKKRVHLMRMTTYENKHSRVRELYNDAMRIKNEASKNSCEALAREIDEFENTILKNETNKLMASQRR